MKMKNFLTVMRRAAREATGEREGNDSAQRVG